MLSLIRVPVFRRVWFGQLVSMIGDGVYTVAVTLYLLGRNDASHALGTLLGSTALGTVLALTVGGAIADRSRRSLVVVAADALRATAIGGLLVAGSDAHLLSLAAVGTIFGLGAGLHRPAYAALLAELGGREKRREVSALRSATSRFAAVLGPALGGWIAASWDSVTAILVDVCTFAISVITLVALRETKPPKEAAERPGILREAAEGVGYVVRQRWMFAIMLQGTAQAALVAAPVAVLLPFVTGHRGAASLSMVTSAEALGSLAASLLSSRLRPNRPGAVALGSLLLELPLLIAMMLDSTTLVIAACSAMAGAGMGVFAVIWGSALQERTPVAMLGRVFALDSLLMSAVSPVFVAMAGYAIGTFSVSSICAFAAVSLVATVVGVLPFPGVLKLGAETPVHEAQPAPLKG
ncbi:MFS transporter [Streptomyces sp. NPDC004561]